MAWSVIKKKEVLNTSQADVIPWCGKNAATPCDSYRKNLGEH